MGRAALVCRGRAAPVILVLRVLDFPRLPQSTGRRRGGRTLQVELKALSTITRLDPYFWQFPRSGEGAWLGRRVTSQRFCDKIMPESRDEKNENKSFNRERKAPRIFFPIVKE